jgi:uncharacterized protein YndB with AHSA1/START domain
MSKGEMIVAINRPIADVFAFVADGTKTPQWQSEVVAARRTSRGAIGVGATYQAMRTQSRQEVASTFEITEYEPYKRVTFAYTAGEAACVDSYAFQAVGSGTRVTYAFETGVKTRTGRFLCQREAMDLSNLKAALEVGDVAAARAMGY